MVHCFNMNGQKQGLLVGAVIAQRPGLFKVALPAVGVMDMLRYHKFTIGWAWAGDYGTSDDSTGFRYLRQYSPLHNLKPGTRYPATLITTADHDDRVVPAHSFKFAARLQEVQEGQNPALIRIDTGAGHGAGKPGHQDSAARGQIAVATWQKSTARRLVSNCVALVTNPMLCGRGRAVTVTPPPLGPRA